MTDVICLFEYSGLSAAPWAEAGYDVYCYDKLHAEKSITHLGAGRIIRRPWDATSPSQNESLIARHAGRCAIVLAFPPCTDLAVSGAAHFARKRRNNPDFQIEALHLALTAESIGSALECPWAIENPISVLSTLWRKPDHIFHPWYFGGYLPEDDIHPLYPDYIAPRDAYPKRTCYWLGGGFIFPPKMPVYCPPGYSKQHRKLGGNSLKTKLIRNASPRGIAQAIFVTNSPQ